MNRLRHNRLKPLLILFAALLLRVVIPAGYMPAAGSGLWFEFCPDGVPASFMQGLAGDSGHEHGHMAHGESGHDDHQCPVGHMLLSAVTVDDVWHLETDPGQQAPGTAPIYSITNVSRTNYYSRGPPA